MEPPTREEWGPLVWRIMHLQALAYVDEPTDQDKQRAKHYYESLAQFLPCPECMEHFAEVLAALPIDAHLDSPKQLIDWTHAVHNRVNARLGKAEISKQEFYKLYASDAAPGRLRDPSAPQVSKTRAAPTFARAAELRRQDVKEPAAPPVAPPAAPKSAPRAMPQQVRAVRPPQVPTRSALPVQPKRPAPKAAPPTTPAAPAPIAGRRTLKIGPPKPVGHRATKGCTNCR